MKKPTRVGGIIETAEGGGSVLMIQDLKPKRRDRIIQNLKQTPNKTREQIKNIIELATGGLFCLPGGEIGRGESPKEALLRELYEEFMVLAEERDMIELKEINQATRDQLLYVVRVRGKITLNERKLTGVGFLNEQPILPRDWRFFMPHVLSIYREYILNPQVRRQFQLGYLSDIYINERLVKDWKKDQERAYLFRSAEVLKREKISPPQDVISTPNFQIHDDSLRLAPPASLTTLTTSPTAKIIPRRP